MRTLLATDSFGLMCYKEQQNALLHVVVYICVHFPVYFATQEATFFSSITDVKRLLSFV